jgi:hypothetical protein
MKVYGYWTIGGGFILAHADPEEDSAPLVTIEFHNEMASASGEAKAVAVGGLAEMMRIRSSDTAREGE